ncbi:hypothetical protein F4677DRAFT_448964 [Hypoxylon crocopeplum]|nr:hypothetical protein F4677DRAFT_448964 [Hypoxylon crocopeplum]
MSSICSRSPISKEDGEQIKTYLDVQCNMLAVQLTGKTASHIRDGETHGGATIRRDLQITATICELSLKSNVLVLVSTGAFQAKPRDHLSMGTKTKRKLSTKWSQGWQNNYLGHQSNQSITDDCHSKLISIAKSIHAANKQYLSIVKEYLRWWAWRGSRKSYFSGQMFPKFDDNDLRILDDAVKEQPQIDRSAIEQLIQSLCKTTYIKIWEQAAENMAYLRQHPKHQTQKHLDNGKKRAVELKNCRVAVESGFCLIKKELRTLGYGDICDGILDKIQTLRKYEEAYPIASEHRVFQLSSQAAALMSINSVATILSLIPMGFAWSKSTGDPGSTDDPDFYQLMSGAAMQILGLYTAVWTVHKRSQDNPNAWRRALFLTAGGVACACAAVPLYIFVPTMWSAFASFFATAFQAGVTLELALMTELPKLKQA